jgi:hypothetical protein
MAIEFDVENLIGKVDAITATQLPYAGSRAMNQLGWQLKSEAWPVFAKQRFDRPVPFTESALRYKHEKGSLSLLVEFNTEAPKGQDPARYLFPTSTGSSIYITRFTKALRQKGIIPSSYVAIPNTRGRALAGEINQYGNVKPGFYQAVLKALDRNAGDRTRSKYRDYRFFSVPDNRKPQRSGQHLKPGIYRAKGTSLDGLLFSYTQDTPSVPRIWDFEEFATAATNERLPVLLNKYIAEALR